MVFFFDDGPSIWFWLAVGLLVVILAAICFFVGQWVGDPCQHVKNLPSMAEALWHNKNFAWDIRHLHTAWAKREALVSYCDVR